MKHTPFQSNLPVPPATLAPPQFITTPAPVLRIAVARQEGNAVYATAPNAVVVGSIVTKDPTADRVYLTDASDATQRALGVVTNVIDATTCVVRRFGGIGAAPKRAMVLHKHRRGAPSIGGR